MHHAANPSLSLITLLNGCSICALQIYNCGLMPLKLPECAPVCVGIGTEWLNVPIPTKDE
jgi:hypothetical protein